MKTIYTYNGVDYTNTFEVRQAIWENEHKVFPDEPTTEPERTQFWNDLGVTIRQEPEPEPSIEELKEAKYSENNEKAEIAREGQAFTATIDGTTLSFLTDRKTQQDLQTALTFLQAGQQSYTWIDEEGVSFDFTTPAQIIQVSTVFMEKANVYPTWLFYKTQIDEATTVEEVRAIVIDYGINLEA